MRRWRLLEVRVQEVRVCEQVETTGGDESVGGEGVSRWRPLEEMRVWEVRVCEQVETTGGGESV